MERSVAFFYLFRVEPRRLELTIHVACENAVAVQGVLPPLPQQVETAVGLRLSIKLKSMPVEAPSSGGVVNERARAGDLLKVDLFFRQGRVRIPKPFVAPEIWQTRINPDASPCCDDDHVGLGDELGGVLH